MLLVTVGSPGHNTPRKGGDRGRDRVRSVPLECQAGMTRPLHDTAPGARAPTGSAPLQGGTHPVAEVDTRLDAGVPAPLPAAALALGASGRRPAASGRSASLARSCRTALVWIWHTRLSVTPRMSPISARVRPS